MKRRSYAAILTLMLCAVILIGCAGSNGVSKESFDFRECSEDGLPIGWSVVSYENSSSVTCEDGVVTIASDTLNDCRLVHDIPVAASTRYVLRAELCTEGVSDGEGATLSIDNYSIDGSYLYSNGVYGTNDWETVTLAFETAKSQESVRIALRLGGYSSVSEGVARFRNITVEKSDSAPVPFQKLATRSSQTKASEKAEGSYEAFFSLIAWSTIFAAAALLYGIYRHFDSLQAASLPKRTGYAIFAAVVLIGFVIRLLLCSVYQGHATDMSCWIAWGNQIANGGFATFYDGTWYDYPPGYMLILGGMQTLMRVLHVADWESETLRLFWYMLPAFLADIGCGLLILRFCKEQDCPDAMGLTLAGLIVLNPAVFFLSGAWGQIDSILTLFLLLSFEALRKDRRILCGIWFAIAVLIKWQALIYGPVLAIVYIATLATQKDRRLQRTDLIKSVVAVASSLLLIFLVSLPFRGTMSPFWIVERFFKASSGYDYATVEGYNFFALLGANWTRADADLFRGASAGGALLNALSTAGKLVFPTAIVWIGFESVRDFKTRNGIGSYLTLGFMALAFGIIQLITFAFPEAESFYWVLLGTVGVLGMIGWLLQNAKLSELKTFLSTNDSAFYGSVIGLLGLILPIGCWILWLIGKLLPQGFTFKMFGIIAIVAALGGVIWMVFRYTRADRMHERDPEVLYLTAACFMLWVFTFGHYMHERYVFPVLILLLFAYAGSKDKRILLAALLLSVTTFLNEQVAMYVVSDGAIDAIRGGERHNHFLAVCSALEVLSTFYLTTAVVRKEIALGKGVKA